MKIEIIHRINAGTDDINRALEWAHSLHKKDILSDTEINEIVERYVAANMSRHLRQAKLRGNAIIVNVNAPDGNRT